MLTKKKVIVLNVFVSIVFILLFRELYVDCLATVYDFYGYRVENNSTIAIWITNLLIVFPIFFYTAEARISDVFSIFCYVMIYVPTLLGLQYYYANYSFVLPYQIAYLIAMVLFFLSGRNSISKQVIKIRYGSISKKKYIFWGVVFLFLFVFVFHSQMRLVSFSDVYDLRSESSDTLSSVPFMGYIAMWIANTFSPLFIALGCEKRNNKLLALGFIISLAYYMATGMKASVFIPIMSFLFFKFFKTNASSKMPYLYVFLVSGLLFTYIIFKFFYGDSTKMIVGLLMMRTYGIATIETPIYIDVFQNYPYTYYSHIGIIGKITGLYPFTNPSLGHAISEAYGGYDPESNANANFLVTDGIAAGGIIGVLFISVFVYFLFSYLNKLSNNFSFPFIIASLTGIIVGFTNMSIFTTILSAGLFILLLFYRYTRV